MLLGRYELLNKIATGGMADVFEARQWGDAHMSRRVVVKRLHSELAKERSALVDLKNEASILGCLQVPGVPRLIDFRCMGGVWFVVMEIIRGPTLRELLDHGISTEAKLAVLAGLSDVLMDIHGATDEAGEPLGIVHGDLTPRNVVVDGAGRVHLVDFGLARLGDTEPPDGTRGTTGYFAPEALKRDAAYDRRADLFSLAALTCEVLSGSLPFDASSVPAYLGAVEAQRFRELSGLAILDDGAAVLQQCLAYSSAHRPFAVSVFAPYFGSPNPAALFEVVRRDFAEVLVAKEASSRAPGFMVAIPPPTPAPVESDGRRLSSAERSAFTADLAFFAPDDGGDFEEAFDFDVVESESGSFDAEPVSVEGGQDVFELETIDSPLIEGDALDSFATPAHFEVDDEFDAFAKPDADFYPDRIAAETFSIERSDLLSQNKPAQAPPARKRSRGIASESRPDIEAAEVPESEEHGSGFYIYVDED